MYDDDSLTASSPPSPPVPIPQSPHRVTTPHLVLAGDCSLPRKRRREAPHPFQSALAFPACGPGRLVTARSAAGGLSFHRPNEDKDNCRSAFPSGGHSDSTTEAIMESQVDPVDPSTSEEWNDVDPTPSERVSFPPKIDPRCEAEWRIPNFMGRQRELFAVERHYSEIHEFEGGLRCRLMMLCRLLSDRDVQIGLFVEVQTPKQLEDLVPTDVIWRYPDVSYYVAALDCQTGDWRRGSKFNCDIFSFSESDRDRGWHEFLRAREISRMVDNEGALRLRFGAMSNGCQWIRIADEERRYGGLKNHGATCYLNSVLQCLFHIGVFTHALYCTTKAEDDALLKVRREQLEAGHPIASAEGKPLAAAMRDLRKLRPIFREGGGGPGTEVSGPPPASPADLEPANLLDAENSDENIADDQSWTDEQIDMALEKIEPQWKVSDEIEIPASEGNSVVRALQRVFFNLSLAPEETNVAPSRPAVDQLLSRAMQPPVLCRELIESFGWTAGDQLVQHDAQELNRLLCDRLEETMRGTPSDGVIKKLFQGESCCYINCTDVNYKSERKEIFYDVQLPVKGLASMTASLDDYMQEEILEGENAYHAEGHGRQRARKGTRFVSFPPVLQFHLKRFEFVEFDMVKVHDRFEFPERIDLSPWCPGAENYELMAVNVHSGGVHEGHYIAFVKCQTTADSPERSWHKFDDEVVWESDERLAVLNNFGGSTAEPPWAIWRGSRETTRAKPFSAYMLFYVKESMANQMLRPLNPILANPGMAVRIALQEQLRQRLARIRRDLHTRVKVHIITEAELRLRPAGPYTDIRRCIPPLRSFKLPRSTTIYEFYKDLVIGIKSGVYGERLQGLYFPSTSPADSSVLGSLTPAGIPSSGGSLHPPTARQPVLCPGLWYFDYDEEDRGMIQAGQECGWGESLCSQNELGLGVKLYQLDPLYEATPATIESHLKLTDQSLQDPRRAALFVYVHPIPLENVSVEPGESPFPLLGRLPPMQLSKAMKNRILVLIKIFDCFHPDLVRQDVYFIGTLDLARKKRTMLSLPLQAPDPQREVTQLVANACRSHPDLQGVLQRSAPQLADWLARGGPQTWQFFYEGRGFYRNEASLDQLHECVVCIVPQLAAGELRRESPSMLLPAGDLPPLTEQPTGEKMQDADVEEDRVDKPGVDETTALEEPRYFNGLDASRLPWVKRRSTVLPPVGQPADNPQQWLHELRSMRRVRIDVVDLPRYFGASEFLDRSRRQCLPSEPQTPALTTTSTPKTVSAKTSPDEEVDLPLACGWPSAPIALSVEVELNTRWRLADWLRPICESALGLDARYLWCLRRAHEPILSGASQGERRPTTGAPFSLAGNEWSDTVVGHLLIAEVREGLTRGYLPRACEVLGVCEDGAVRLQLGLWPIPVLSNVSNGGGVIKLFDPTLGGSLGAVFLPEIPTSIERLVDQVVGAVPPRQLQRVLGDKLAADAWLRRTTSSSEAFQLVQYAAHFVRLAACRVDNLSQVFTPSRMFSMQFRVEPQIPWLPVDVPKPHENLFPVEVVQFCECTDRMVGYAFQFLVAFEEPWGSVQSRLEQAIMRQGLPSMMTRTIEAWDAGFVKKNLRDTDPLVDVKAVESRQQQQQPCLRQRLIIAVRHSVCISTTHAAAAEGGPLRRRRLINMATHD